MNWLKDDYQNLLIELVNYNDTKDERISVEDNIFSTFQVDLEREIKNQFVYLKYASLQPSEIREMYYWEWEMMLMELEEHMKKEKEQQEQEQEQQNSYKDSKEYSDAKRMMSSSSAMSSGYSKMGMPSIKLPSI